MPLDGVFIHPTLPPATESQLAAFLLLEPVIGREDDALFSDRGVARARARERALRAYLIVCIANFTRLCVLYEPLVSVTVISPSSSPTAYSFWRAFLTLLAFRMLRPYAISISSESM